MAEDHQTKNALALVNKQAAIYVKDSEAETNLMDVALSTVKDEQKLKELSENIARLAFTRFCKNHCTGGYQTGGKKNNKKKRQRNEYRNDKISLFRRCRRHRNECTCTLLPFKGKVVAGYDRTPTPLTENPRSPKAHKYITKKNVDLIPEACKDKESTLVVFTPAVPQEHEELVYFRNNGFEIQKRAQVLGTITHSSKGLCVAGTHGKTTTSTMTAHLFHQSHVECTAFLGGISKNYGTNLLLSQASPYTVIEADEFDRSFHWLSPYMTVITSTDPDHLDIYGTEQAYLKVSNITPR